MLLVIRPEEMMSTPRFFTVLTLVWIIYIINIEDAIEHTVHSYNPMV